MWVLALIALMAGGLAVLGFVLWVGWGRRKLGVSLVGAGLFLVLLAMMLPALETMLWSVTGSASVLTGCFGVDG